MFGLGIWELALIAVVALLVLGPEKLPDAAKELGKALRDFRRAGDDLKREMIGELDEPASRPPPPVAVAPDPNSQPKAVEGQAKPAESPAKPAEVQAKPAESQAKPAEIQAKPAESQAKAVEPAEDAKNRPEKS